jgi:hypothetical protein
MCYRKRSSLARNNYSQTAGGLFTAFFFATGSKSLLCRHLFVTRLCEGLSVTDIIAHWNGFESISIGASVLTVARRALAQAVFQAAEVGDWPKSTGTESSAPVPVLRSVLLYCLATNTCASQEIVEASENDSAVKYLCANHSLDWPMVHEFRKRNNLVIRDALAAVFQAVCGAAPSLALKRIARLEADVRIRRAVQADSTVLDL